MLTKKLRLLAVILAIGVPGFAQAQSFKPFGDRIHHTSGKLDQTTAALDKGTFDLDLNALAGIRRFSHVTIEQVPLAKAGGPSQLVDLDMTEFNVLAPDVKFTLKTAAGDVEGPRPTVKLYRGSVKGVAGSYAYLAVTEGGVSGRIQMPDADYNVGFKPIGNGSEAIILDQHEIPSAIAQAKCDVSDDDRYAPLGTLPAPEVSSNRNPKQEKVAGAASVAANVAIEADFETYQWFESNEQKVTDFLVARFGAISGVYEKELGCAIQVSSLDIYKTNDPYPTVSNTDPLLQAFTNYWAANKGNVNRTIAHLVSRQNFDNPNYSSGLAWLGVLCNKQIGYGVTRIMGSDQFPTIDEAVMAHEIGHNFGSNHTHNCKQWGVAIDSCVAAEEGSCFGATHQSKGTIMSYCNDKAFTFGKRVQDFLVGVVESSTDCLVPVGPAVGELQLLSNEVRISNIKPGQAKDTIVKGFFKNVGTKAMSVKSMALTGDAAFSITGPQLPLSLAPKASADLRLHFEAPSEGEAQASLNITSGDETIQSVSLVGTTSGGGGSNKPLQFSTGTTIKWNTRKVGSTYDTVITVTNKTSATITTLQPKWTPTNPAGFSIVGQQLLTINAGQSKQLTLRFNPPANKAYSADLILPFGTGQDTLHLSGTGTFNTQGVEEDAGLHLQLSAVPNPFTKSLKIEIVAPESMTGSRVTVDVFDILGRKVMNLFDSRLVDQKLRLDFHPDRDLQSGTYYVVAQSGEVVMTRKIVYNP